jgi:type I restriction enzyme S subunit
MTASADWRPKQLTELADYINGYAFKPEDWAKDGLPIIRIEQLKNPDASADYYNGKLPSANIIEDGDLIFSWSASLFLRIWHHGRAALNQHLFKVIERDGIDRAFLKAFIEFYLPSLTAASHGSTMQHITRKELVRFRAPVPDSTLEQTKIAEILSAVDQAIEQTESLIAKQQRVKAGLTQDLLTAGIDEHGNLRSEQTHAFKDSHLGRIPEDWEAVPIASVLAEPPKNGYSPVESNEWNGSYVLGLGCLTPDGFRPKQLKFAPRATPSAEGARLHPGDFLISRSNTRPLVGLVGIFKDVGEPCIYPDLMVRLVFSDAVCPDYMEQVFMSSFMRRQIENAATGTSGSMVKISGALIKKFAFMKPPVEEQRRIRSLLKIEAAALDSNVHLFSKLSSLKAGLMQDLLTGRKRVTALLESKP